MCGISGNSCVPSSHSLGFKAAARLCRYGLSCRCCCILLGKLRKGCSVFALKGLALLPGRRKELCSISDVTLWKNIFCTRYYAEVLKVHSVIVSLTWWWLCWMPPVVIVTVALWQCFFFLNFGGRKSPGKQLSHTLLFAAHLLTWYFNCSTVHVF